jgi:hypothetical protein
VANGELSADNRRVRTSSRLALIATLLLAGQPQARAADSTVIIYRCIDAKGHVSLQDDPCPKDTTQQSARNMVRPQDPPYHPVASQPPLPPTSPPEPPVAETPYFLPPPPPPLYQCTSYDGIVRESEVYDPNPRCEPVVLYFPYPRQLTPAQAGSCRWVQDSCVRLSDEATCERFRQKKREAASALQHAFSDTEAYRKSELQRFTQIVDESCR